MMPPVQMFTNWFQVQKLPVDHSSNLLARVATIVLLAVAAHFLVRLVRFAGDWLVTRNAMSKTPVGFVTRKPKFITLTGLVASGLTFIIYSIALGYVAALFGMDPAQFITTYLATASVLGLAVGFGSQGLVQDVVTGLTLIFSDTLDVGDMIEVSGQVGRVERVGLRFTQLTNFLNQEVFVPNRTIGNIARFPAGGIHAYADIQIPSEAHRKTATEIAARIARGMWLQFNGIVLAEPECVGTETLAPVTGNYLRVQFKIWPGQGALLETTFRSRIVDAMKALQPAYADWMVAITYRATTRPPELPEPSVANSASEQDLK